MSSKTADISQFFELSFYKWVMFWEASKLLPFPDENPKLGQYLGVAINVGPAMTTKILNAKTGCLLLHLLRTDRERGYQYGAYCTTQ